MATCILCNWESNETKETHLPRIVIGSDTHICTDCFTRCKTVDSFGLTTEELKKASEEYLERQRAKYVS